MSAERGWIGEPQPPGREPYPGEERKWQFMMGRGQLLTDDDKERLARFWDKQDAGGEQSFRSAAAAET